MGMLKGRVVISVRSSGDWALITGRKLILNKRYCLPVSIHLNQTFPLIEIEIGGELTFFTQNMWKTMGGVSDIYMENM